MVFINIDMVFINIDMVFINIDMVFINIKKGLYLKIQSLLHTGLFYFTNFLFAAQSAVIKSRSSFVSLYPL